MSDPGAVPRIPIRRNERSASRSDDVDFEIHGAETQFVEIELDPGESAVAEAGAMMMKHRDITITTVFGDGSAEQQGGSFFDKLVGAGKRLVTGRACSPPSSPTRATARRGFPSRPPILITSWR